MTSAQQHEKANSKMKQRKRPNRAMHRRKLMEFVEQSEDRSLLAVTFTSI